MTEDTISDDNWGLSPEAADDLRRIAGREPDPTNRHLFQLLGVEQIICIDCGHLNTFGSSCAECRARFQYPLEADTGSYLTAVDLIQRGDLSPAHLQELLDKLRGEYTFYFAGTRYSVFGPDFSC